MNKIFQNLFQNIKASRSLIAAVMLTALVFMPVFAAPGQQPPAGNIVPSFDSVITNNADPNINFGYGASFWGTSVGVNGKATDANGTGGDFISNYIGVSGTATNGQTTTGVNGIAEGPFSMGGNFKGDTTGVVGNSDLGTGGDFTGRNTGLRATVTAPKGVAANFTGFIGVEAITNSSGGAAGSFSSDQNNSAAGFFNVTGTGSTAGLFSASNDNSIAGSFTTNGTNSPAGSFVTKGDNSAAGTFIASGNNSPAASFTANGANSVAGSFVANGQNGVGASFRGPEALRAISTSADRQAAYFSGEQTGNTVSLVKPKGNGDWGYAIKAHDGDMFGWAGYFEATGVLGVAGMFQTSNTNGMAGYFQSVGSGSIGVVGIATENLSSGAAFQGTAFGLRSISTGNGPNPSAAGYFEGANVLNNGTGLNVLVHNAGNIGAHLQNDNGDYVDLLKDKTALKTNGSIYAGSIGSFYTRTSLAPTTLQPYVNPTTVFDTNSYNSSYATCDAGSLRVSCSILTNGANLVQADQSFPNDSSCNVYAQNLNTKKVQSFKAMITCFDPTGVAKTGALSAN